MTIVIYQTKRRMIKVMTALSLIPLFGSQIETLRKEKALNSLIFEGFHAWHIFERLPGTQPTIMNHKPTLIKLYHLLISADGSISEKELDAGKQMIQAEGINEFEFDRMITNLKKRNATVLYSECVEELKRLDNDKQTRCIAWLSLIANSDGFMDKTEWHFIYKLYHVELGLQLDDVMKKQKDLFSIKEKP